MILITRMDNGNSDWIFTKPEELDSSIYADALKMTEEKYASGTQI